MNKYFDDNGPTQALYDLQEEFDAAHEIVACALAAHAEGFEPVSDAGATIETVLRFIAMAKDLTLEG